jgi:hypothetical protein
VDAPLLTVPLINNPSAARTLGLSVTVFESDSMDRSDVGEAGACLVLVAEADLLAGNRKAGDLDKKPGTPPTLISPGGKSFNSHVHGTAPAVTVTS